MVSACNGWSSVCTESVHSTVYHCARVALVITVDSGAHVQAIKQLNEHHVIHARRNNTGLNVCSAHLMCELQVLSRMNFKPLSRSRFRVLTHIQAFTLLCKKKWSARRRSLKNTVWHHFTCSLFLHVLVCLASQRTIE